MDLRHLRGTVRAVVIAAATGALTLAAAWAGIGVMPPPVSQDTSAVDVEVVTSQPATVSGAVLADVGEGQVLAGAAKVSIEPRPEDYDAVWEKEDCDVSDDPEHIANTRTPFPVNPNCLYIWGVGPGQPIIDWDDEFGLWSRSVALSDGEDTMVLTMLDGFSYFAFYNNFCDDCGALQLAEELGAELGFDPAGFFLHSTHSHAAPDLIGSGGGVAQWYMDQVADSIRASVTAAVETMAPARVEAGEVLARGFNRERRDTYYSAEDAALSWFRAIAVDENGADADVIATVGAFPAHPVSRGANGGVAHPDWPGGFVKQTETRFGGLGFFFQTGLGNMSSRNPQGSSRDMGFPLADLLPEAGNGTALTDTDIRVARDQWSQPYTNVVIGALGASGVFDREIGGPATITTGRHEARQCHATSPTSVLTQVNAARVGPMLITGAPGEVFSNLTNTIKERHPDGITLPLGQINDGLGYIMQEFESDYVYGQRTVEYEETFGSACFGEVVLAKTLELIGELSS